MRTVLLRDGPAVVLMHLLWCPGCDDLHAPRSTLGAGSIGATWQWDGNRERPTFSPSLLVRYGDAADGRRCHSFVRAGRWEYLTDSTHLFAGMTVELWPLPPWVAGDA